jgi:hypothetical protein
MRIRLFSVLLALLTAAPAVAQQTQAYLSDTGFTLDLPAHWVRAPDRALAAMSSPMTSEITYEALFQLTDARLPRPPYVVIARMDLPQPTTQEEFAASFRSPNPQAEMQESLDQGPAARAGARAGVPRWDAENGVAWARVSLQSNGSTAGFAWSVVMLAPSRRAVISILYYGAPGADETPVLAQLESILRTVRAS